MTSTSKQRIGIIDIGSNSIRLVLYEQVGPMAYRVLDESKASARLSDRIRGDQTLSEADMQAIARIVRHFLLLCEANGASRIRAAATAAIRNAANSADIVRFLKEQTGLEVEVLSGEDEARYGFIGVMNTMDIRDGFLIDIGGGSTEVSLFRDRKLLHSVSFPFGAVNTAKRYSRQGSMNEQEYGQLKRMIDKALMSLDWIRANPGLPMIGLGGTMRSVCKLDQKRKRYSLPLTHRYEMQGQDVEQLLRMLMTLPPDKRKKLDGLSKDRQDLIVPGMAILQTIYEAAGASHYVVSGSGLRDGLFYAAMSPDKPLLSDILTHSVDNLLALHPSQPMPHLRQVNRLALGIFDDLAGYHGLSGRVRQYLHAASMLYRIGVSVNYYHYYRHTFYLMAHSRIDGLSHRETLICAMTAAYHTKSKTRQLLSEFRDILSDADFRLVTQLGSLLQLAVALDRSETQPVEQATARVFKKELSLFIEKRRPIDLERSAVEAVGKDFQKIWGLKLQLHE